MVELSGEVVEGFEGAAGPVAARSLRDGEQRTPIVRQTVVGAGRHGWIARLEDGEMVLSPAGAG